MTEISLSNTNKNREAIARGQQEWEEILLSYKEERRKLQTAIQFGERKAAGKLSPDLDEAKLQLIQLEVIMKRHFTYAYKITYLVDVAMKYDSQKYSNEYLPLNRNEKIHGMTYTNYGILPFPDPGTRAGYYNTEVLKTRSQLKTRWSTFMSNLETFYDENKGTIRQLCESGGDKVASEISKVIIPIGFPQGPLPHKLHSKFVDELVDRSNKPLSPGKSVCDLLLGRKAKPFALPK